MPSSKITWKKNMAFNVELNGHNFTIDATAKVGGQNRGPRPKSLVLSALGGCTGMDVVSILAKMKVIDFEFEVDVKADQTDEHPVIFKDIVITYSFVGKDLPIKKILRAIELSETRYCGVSEMLRATTKISNIVKINGEII